jgi:transposase
LFLPPYSPDLNPIEMASPNSKHRLRAKAVRTIDSALGRFGLNELPTQITIVTRTAIAAWQDRHAVSHELPPP